MLHTTRDLLSSANDLYLQGGLNIQAGLDLFDREWANIMAGQAWAENNLENNPSAAELCKRYPAAGAYVIDLRLNPLQKITWLETALSAARQQNDRNIEGVHLGNLGRTYAALGDSKKAIQYYEQALAIDREIGDRRGEGAWLGNMGLAYADLGETYTATEYNMQNLAISREIGDRSGEAYASWNLGGEYEKAGDLKQAANLMQVCVDFEREIGHQDAEKDAARLEAVRAKLRVNE
jgi:tetratricopeptide (TPR) repeat protein